MDPEGQGVSSQPGPKSRKQMTLLVQQGQPVAVTLIAAALTVLFQWRNNRKLNKENKSLRKARELDLTELQVRAQKEQELRVKFEELHAKNEGEVAMRISLQNNIASVEIEAREVEAQYERFQARAKHCQDANHELLRKLASARLRINELESGYQGNGEGSASSYGGQSARSTASSQVTENTFVLEAPPLADAFKRGLGWSSRMPKFPPVPFKDLTFSRASRNNGGN